MLGVCWVLTLYSRDCVTTNGKPTFIKGEETLASSALHNIRRSLEANPTLPACILVTTPMAARLWRPLIERYVRVAPRGARRWLSAIHVVPLPCRVPVIDSELRAIIMPEPKSEPAWARLIPLRQPAPPPGVGARSSDGGEDSGAGGGAEHSSQRNAYEAGAPCSLCALAADELDAHKEIPGPLQRNAKIGRYSRLHKIAAVGSTPFETTLLVDADVSLRADVAESIAGVDDAMAAVNASLSVRIAEHNTHQGPAAACEERCKSQAVLLAGPRAHMRCVTRCLNRLPLTFCKANTGVMVVRRSVQASQVGDVARRERRAPRWCASSARKALAPRIS